MSTVSVKYDASLVKEKSVEWHSIFRQATCTLLALKTTVLTEIDHCNESPVMSGWPRSGWPQVGHFDQKIKVNQIASYCAMLYPRCCSLWPCTFLGCIPPPLTPLQVKPEALILISIGGRTLQCGVVYMFYALVLPKLTFINNCGIGKSKGL